MMKKSYVLFALIILMLCIFAACDKSPVKDNETNPVTETETATEKETQTSSPTESEGDCPSETESDKDLPDESESEDTGTEECEHSYNEGDVTVTPSCSKEGIRTLTCKLCGDKKTETVEKTAHELGHWTEIKAPTTEEEGVERAKCENCEYYEERALNILEMRYYITVDDGVNEPIQLEFGKDGKYTLEDPIKIGYNFLGWKTAEGKDFSSSGTVSENISIKAEWELDGTDSLKELVERAGAGVDKIVITKDITVTEPIFFTGATTLSSEGDHVIKRDPSFAGDIFVVGQDKNGTGSVWFGTNVVLDISGETGTLTVDGNRDVLEVTVVGSAIFVSDSATVNIYDNVVIANNKKLGNERTFTCKAFAGETTMTRAGGAAIIIMNGTVNMYGGVIENNIVFTEYTPKKNDDGSDYNAEDAGCGGAIYNYGNFKMYGGVIRNNEALRGGSIYNDEIIHLVSGSIENSLSHSYGGAVSSSSSATAQMFIGSNGKSDKKMSFTSNRSLYTGGALYSNTNSPIVIYGNTEFTQNSSASSGGAIYTAGGLTVRGATFTENFSDSASGGAIYYLYGKAEYSRRYMELTDCTFIKNSANLGGAVILSAKDECEEMGTYATVTGCKFIENQAIILNGKQGNGGAMYITRKSEATISNCEFTGNVAQTNGGALSIQSGAKVTVSNVTFTKNRSTVGGAINTANATVVDIDGATFTENSAILTENGSAGNAGAIYVASATITLKNVEMSGNTAQNNGGALYISAVAVGLDSTVSFKNNTAVGHGGAIYVTYTSNSDGTKNGGVLNATGVSFENNSAIAGGAISARSASTLTITDVSFKGNTTPGAEVGTGNGGGAIYSNNSTLTLKNVIMDANTSGYYGGSMKLDECETTVENVEILNSTGGTGGAIYASGGTFNANGLTLTNNRSELNGVIYLTKITSTVNELNASGNEAISGGVIYASTNASLTLTASTLTSNKAGNGGAIYAAKNSTVSVSASSFDKNESSKYGGAIIALGATLSIKDSSTFKSNTSATYGGAIYVNDQVDKVEHIPEGTTEPVEEEVIYKSTFSVDGARFENNVSGSGAAVYVGRNEYAISNAQFISNVATGESYGGAAIYNTAAKSTLSNVTFIYNTSHKGGAVALHSESEMTVTSMVAQGNSATLNSDNALGVGGVFYVNNSTLNLIASEGESITFGGEEDGKGNTAQTGGAIQTENKATLIVKGAIFCSNSAIGNGGAIYSNAGFLELCDVTMSANESGNHGGAVSVSGTVVTVSGDSKFINNTATKHAGAIYVSYAGENYGNLTVIGGLFEGNTALGGGAVSVRSNCKATFNETVFTKNSVAGNDGVNDGDGEGGGAIYVGYGELVLNNVTAEANSAEGHGGAVDSYNAKVTVMGGSYTNNTAPTGGAFCHNTKTISIKDATITNNSNGLYVAKGKLEVSGKVTVKDNANNETSNNVYLADGIVITVVGTLDEGSLIGVNTSEAGRVLAEADGTNIKDISDTVNRFFCDSGIPTYANGDGKIACGFVIITQPTYFNGYKVSASGDPTYAWFIWGNGEMGEAIEGENENVLKNKTTGICYVCRITFGDETLITDPVTYMPESSHPICGEVCDCSDITHEGVTWLPITNKAELEYAAKNGGNYYLATDVVLEKTLNVSKDLALCLNGKKMSRTGGDKFSLINVPASVTLTLTDCSNAERAGYIDPETGLWTEGEYTGEGEAIAYTLYGGVITGGYATNGGAIYSTGNITLYGVNFAGNTATGNGGAIDMVGGELMASGNNVFVGNVAVGHAGAIYLTYTKNADQTTDASLATVSEGLFEYNGAMGGGAISIRTACEGIFKGTTFRNNSSKGYSDKNDGDGEGGGAIYVGYGKLTLENVIAANNTSEFYGAAVDAVSATVTVTGGRYENNNALYSGAFYVITSSNVTVSGTTFTANSSTYANTENNANFGGGAINIKNSTIEMSAVILDSNRSGYYGGAINANKSVITIKDNSVIKNSNGKTGAAFNLRSSCTVTVSDALFEGNISTANGVIYANSGTLSFINVIANGNKAYQGGLFYVSGGEITVTELSATENNATNGGVIYVSGAANVMLVDSTLSGNTATNGGAIFTAGGSITVTNTALSDNTATSGGALSIKGGSAALSEKTTLENNTATNGGAIYAEDGFLTLSGADLKENSASSGGALALVNKASAEISNTTFAGNTATGNGGAINANGSTLTLSAGTVFENNTAQTHGGAICIHLHTYEEEQTPDGGTEPETVTVTVKATVLIDGVSFKNNSALRGGALYVSQNAYTVKNSSFITNTATDQNYGGGAIYTTSGSGTLSGIIFTGNTSHKGGAVALHSKSSMTVTSLTATGNIATLNSENGLGTGGVFYVNNSTLALTAGEGESITVGGEAEGSANTAASTGGAIQAENNSSVTIRGAIFIKNTSSGNGGAICSHAGSLTLSDVTMKNNHSDGHGGALSATGTAVTVSGNCAFTQNTAKNHGGAIYLSYTGKTYGTVDMTGGSFDSNSALAGGAVSIRSNCTGTFTGTSFTRNSVTGYADTNDGDGDGGGAIYVGYGTLNLTNVTMSENTAQYFGAAIASAGSTVTVNGGIFEKNSGGYSGAIHAISSSKLTINGTTFKDNKVTDKNADGARGGGAVSAKSKSTVTLIGVIMDGNTSGYYGGAILASAATVTIKDNCEIKNSSGATGSAIYSRDTSTVTIIDSTLSYNNSTGSGVFYANSGTFTVKNTEVKGNTGKNGVFYFSGATVDMTNVTASNNSATTGGVIYANAAGVILTVADSTFTNNSATTGGAIAANKATLTVKSSVFSSNTANSGSDIYVASAAVLSIEGAPISADAGAIYATGSGTGVTVKYATEEEKSAWETIITTASNAAVSYVAS